MKRSALSKRGGAGHLAERNYESQSTIRADSRAGDDDLDELVSVMMTPKGTNRLHVPEVRIINAQVLRMLCRLWKCGLYHCVCEVKKLKLEKKCKSGRKFPDYYDLICRF